MGARRTLLALAASALAVPTFGVASAHAATEPGPIPTECGSRPAFDAELVARLGVEAPLERVLVAISPHHGGFRLRVSVGEEQRELDDPSCTELFRAAIVIAVSMLLEERESARPVSPAPAPVAVSAERAPSPGPSPWPRFSVGVGAGVGVGTLPKPVLALELEGKALWRYVGVGASVRYLLPAERRDENQQGADLRALGASVTGLFRPSHDWEARLGFAGHRLSGDGIGVNRGYSAAVWAAGPTLGLGWLPLRRGPFWGGLGAEGQLNVVRGRFEIINYSGDFNGQRHVVYRVPWLAGGAFVRLGLVW